MTERKSGPSSIKNNRGEALSYIMLAKLPIPAPEFVSYPVPGKMLAETIRTETGTGQRLEGLLETFANLFGGNVSEWSLIFGTADRRLDALAIPYTEEDIDMCSLLSARAVAHISFDLLGDHPQVEEFAMAGVTAAAGKPRIAAARYMAAGRPEAGLYWCGLSTTPADFYLSHYNQHWVSIKNSDYADAGRRFYPEFAGPVTPAMHAITGHSHLLTSHSADFSPESMTVETLGDKGNPIRSAPWQKVYKVEFVPDMNTGLAPGYKIKVGGGSITLPARINVA